MNPRIKWAMVALGVLILGYMLISKPKQPPETTPPATTTDTSKSPVSQLIPETAELHAGLQLAADNEVVKAATNVLGSAQALDVLVKEGKAYPPSDGRTYESKARDLYLKAHQARSITEAQATLTALKELVQEQREALPQPGASYRSSMLFTSRVAHAKPGGPRFMLDQDERLYLYIPDDVAIDVQTPKDKPRVLTLTLTLPEEKPNKPDVEVQEASLRWSGMPHPNTVAHALLLH